MFKKQVNPHLKNVNIFDLQNIYISIKDTLLLMWT